MTAQEYDSPDTYDSQSIDDTSSPSNEGTISENGISNIDQNLGEHPIQTRSTIRVLSALRRFYKYVGIFFLMLAVAILIDLSNQETDSLRRIIYAIGSLALIAYVFDNDLVAELKTTFRTIRNLIQTLWRHIDVY